LADALAGAVAALAALLLTYPVDVHKTRLQASASSSSSSSHRYSKAEEEEREEGEEEEEEADGDGKDEGVCSARGQEDDDDKDIERGAERSCRGPSPLPSLPRPASSSSSSSSSTRIGCSTSTSSSAFAGWKAKVLHTAASSFCYFYLYSSLLSLCQARRRRQRQRRKATTNGGGLQQPTTPSSGGGRPANDNKVVVLSSAAHLLLSAAAAMLNTLVTLPLDVISSRQQVHPHHLGCRDDRTAASASSASASSALAVPGLQMPHPPTAPSRRAPLLSDLWRGLVPSLLLCANPAINYTAYDALKERVLSRSNRQRQQQHRKPHLSSLEAFVLGVAAKFVATMVTYPLIRAKVLLMVGANRTRSCGSNNCSSNCSSNDATADDEPPLSSQPSSSSSSSSPGALSLVRCLADDYRVNGLVRGWYRGCSLQLVHTLVKSALLMAIKEKITGTMREMVMTVASRNGVSASSPSSFSSRA
jgi:Mitochondrial carrier protein